MNTFPSNSLMDDWQYFVEIMYQRSCDEREFFEQPLQDKREFYELNLSHLMNRFDDCRELGVIQ